jgi:hypothetical protein
MQPERIDPAPASLGSLSSLPFLLRLDAAFEFIAGLTLIIFAVPIGRWLAIGTTASLALGTAFLAAGLAVAAIARWREQDRGTVTFLALANTAGGAALWVVLIASWGALESPGRALAGASADAFIALGVLELRALRLSR